MPQQRRLVAAAGIAPRVHAALMAAAALAAGACRRHCRLPTERDTAAPAVATCRFSQQQAGVAAYLLL